jgi:hypothetical protein
LPVLGLRRARARLWKRTQVKWVVLTTLVTALDQRLGPDKGRPQLLTQKSIDNVFDQFLLAVGRAQPLYSVCSSSYGTDY